MPNASKTSLAPRRLVISLTGEISPDDVAAIIKPMAGRADAGSTLGVLAYLVKRCQAPNSDDGWTLISRHEIAAFVNNSTRNVSRALSILLKHGYFTRRSDPRGNCYYKTNTVTASV
jgi:hypothetical protein